MFRIYYIIKTCIHSHYHFQISCTASVSRFTFLPLHFFLFIQLFKFVGLYVNVRYIRVFEYVLSLSTAIQACLFVPTYTCSSFHIDCCGSICGMIRCVYQYFCYYECMDGCIIIFIFLLFHSSPCFLH